MGWKDVDRDMGGQPVLKIEEDGEKVRMVVCGEPDVVTTTAFNQERKRAVFLIIVNGELFRWFTSGKTCRKIRPFAEKLGGNAMIVVRHGEKKDINTTYDVTLAKLTKAETAERVLLLGEQGDNEGIPF